MKKNFVFSILIFVLLIGCGSPAPAATQTATSTPLPPTPTNTALPTSTPTVTPDPLAGAPEGTTGINNKGQWTKTTTEGAITFEWIWDESLNSWVRPLITEYHLIDTIDERGKDAFTFQVFLQEGVLGGETIIALTHENVTSVDDQSEVTSILWGKFVRRIYNKSPMSLQQDEWNKLFVDLGNGDVYLPVMLSGGEKANVRIGPETGIILTIVKPDDLIPLAEEGKAFKVTIINYGIITYITMDGADKNGNAKFRVASNIALNKFQVRYLSGRKIQDFDFRGLIFVCVANILTREDQTGILNISDAYFYAQHSAGLRANGEPDLVIVRAP